MVFAIFSLVFLCRIRDVWGIKDLCQAEKSRLLRAMEGKMGDFRKCIEAEREPYIPYTDVDIERP